MDIQELLDSLAVFDEMEAPDGMNICEGEEEFDDERSENKRKARIYKKAVIALEELQDLVAEDVDPATGKLDDETDAFYNNLTGVINEIDSRALAFTESLNETNLENDNLTDGKIVKSELFNFGIAVQPMDTDLHLGTVGYGTQVKRLSATDYEGENVIEDVAVIVKANLDNMEKEVKNLLHLI